MAISKAFFASLILSFLFVQIIQARLQVDSDQVVSSSGGHRSLLQTIDCKAACTARCRLSSRPNLCHRACGTCCFRCSCVPPGTSGNQEVCPCYANMTTHGGRRKCP
ncbi:hypothetical protein IFM89_005737 [Coptis chinensis]|uniref:Snakin-2 n=1 Tax=Coptis chinensis TaxID=261450 RepID=A0A835IP77_9MAGN|nr:hypothetical protein IFM89_005737 [Coptis chinensis]